MKICPKCATENVDTAKFCNECGASLVITAGNNLIKVVEKDLPKEPHKEDIEYEELGLEKEVQPAEKETTTTQIYSKKDAIFKRKIYLIAGAVLLIFICFILARPHSSHTSKYYVKPREDYTITDPDFDFMDENLKNRIEALMEESIEWYNHIEYNNKKSSVSLSAIEEGDFSSLGSDLLQDKSYRYNKKTLLAVMPSVEAYGELAGYVYNNDNETDSSGETFIYISPDEWMKIHDDLESALNFYYGDGDHTAMNEEEETHYRELREDDKQYIISKLNSKLIHENWLVNVNKNYTIDVEQNSSGGLDVTYKKNIYETISEFINESSYDKETMIETYQKIWNLLDSVVDEFDVYYAGENHLDVEVYGTNSDLLIWINESGASYAK